MFIEKFYIIWSSGINMKVRYAPTINSSPKGPDSRPGFIGSPVKPKNIFASKKL